MSSRGSGAEISIVSRFVQWDGPTDGIGDLAHSIVAHVEIAQALAFYEA